MKNATIPDTQAKVTAYIVTTPSLSVIKITESKREAETYRDTYDEQHRAQRKRATIRTRNIRL